MKHKLRSWKERWHPDAEFVYAKRLRMGIDPKNPWVLPGDPVDKTMFGLSRLRRWWEARVIKLADPNSIVADPNCPRIVRLTNTAWEFRVPGQKAQRTNSLGDAKALWDEYEAGLKQDEICLKQLNSQMWELQIPGQEPKKIRGKNKAKEALVAAQG